MNIINRAQAPTPKFFKVLRTIEIVMLAGTVLSILPNLHSEDFAKTIILAFLGAIVSFTATLLLKMLTKLKRNNPFLIGNLFGLYKKSLFHFEAGFLFYTCAVSASNI